MFNTLRLNMRERVQQDRRLAAFRSYAADDRLPFFRVVESAPGPTAVIEGKSRIMLGANDSLGLGGDARLIAAANRATDRHGTSSEGAPPFCGTSRLKVELEELLADWHGSEAALVYTSGYQANVGALTAILGVGDLALPDSQAHASIHAGIRLSGASSRYFAHNDLKALEHNLIRTADRGGTKMIAIDGLYSMHGDVAPMEGIVALARKYGVGLFVDEAHSVGVFGAKRTGIAEEFGCLHAVDILMGGMSKALGSAGGYIVGSRDLVDFLKMYSNPHMFTATSPPGTLAATIAAIEIIRSPEGEQRAAEVLRNSRALRDGLAAHGLKVGGDIIRSDGSRVVAPIVSVWIGQEDDAVAAWNEAFDNGVFCSLALAPAVGENDSMMRCGVSAAHSSAQIERAVEIIAAAVPSVKDQASEFV
ncbi:aminotransferase class I/II-fold pyridoxal phosphate-dependent enzyme [Mycobacterium vicinigordonae]|uniref:8-amino-7-oxononanoate synthase n=1 Tax=Mycobacterium vicinigordonae TaxID=1719132 RepID=A0A7D6HPE8_9MYCO|nr:pyridoxal phosphate-dependent aminotransferase family protein [Mycobacterium vicinigordonae]QLL06971.1 pyridoxal phosphate-dependent aminotransferase family protein [Mycobacterium vicinigordonae]